MKKVAGGITVPHGFLAAGIHCGIKKKKKDLALIYSKVPALACGSFTSNKIKAAPVLVAEEQLKKGNDIQAILINSGNANACTGKRGIGDARKLIAFTAKELGIKKEAVLISSTGVIGRHIPMGKIEQGIKKIIPCLSRNGAGLAAESILTTDTRRKEIAVKVNLNGSLISIGAMAKGSGMIHPGLATMLAFLCTDALIEKRLLRDAFKKALDCSFNMITIDGERSTNDAAIILANGLALNKKVMPGTREAKKFQEALDFVCSFLAKEMVRDAEGATKFIEIKVKNAPDFEQGKAAAFSIARSALVKTAIYGEDPNWGRIISAIGNAPLKKLNPEKIDLYLNKIKLVRNGTAVSGGRKKVRKSMQKKEIEILVNLNSGKEEATVWTSDLTPAYVRINAQYT